MRSETNLRADLLRCFAQKRLDDLLRATPLADRRRLLHDFTLWARPVQLEPEGEDWRLWLVLGGRGAGKSRTGAEWLKRRIRYAPMPLRVALVGPSLQEARSVMVEGESGLLAVHAHDEQLPSFSPTKREMTFPNGSIAQLLSADSPQSLRGPQFHLAWCDELAKWRYRDEAWNMLQFALRLGERPQQIVTTTPKPSALLKQLIEDRQTVLVRTPTSDNWALSRSFVNELERIYGGTRLERQELHGELIEEDPDALFTRSNLDEHRLSKAPPLRRILVAVDPPVSSSKRSDACGIVCAGLGVDGRAYVLDDATRSQLKPAQWARRAACRSDARALGTPG
jgi:phage terminase large subunit-like protein